MQTNVDADPGSGGSRSRPWLIAVCTSMHLHVPSRDHVDDQGRCRGCFAVVSHSLVVGTRGIEPRTPTVSR